MEKRVEEDWPGVAATLDEIRSAILGRKGAIVNLTADAKTMDKADGPVAEMLASLPEAGNQSDVCDWLILPAKNEAFTVPTQVCGLEGMPCSSDWCRMLLRLGYAKWCLGIGHAHGAPHHSLRTQYCT